MTSRDLTVFIGYDSKEPAAAAVLAHSILTRASAPVYFMPLTRKAVERIYTRPRGPTEATEFSMTRFLVPYLSGYHGYSLFIDCDMLCQADIWELMLYPLADPGKAVYVCQHDYVPKSATKMEGQVQTAYPKKNWSSFCLFRNEKCTALTPEYVNAATGLDLHRFHWLRDSDKEGSELSKIGSIPLDWNHLVGEYEPNPNAKILHYTDGGPWFQEHSGCDHADLWFSERDSMLGIAQDKTHERLHLRAG